MRYRPGNAQELGDREEQQDAFAFSDIDDLSFVAHGGVLCVVSDGMGGLAGGREASAAAVRSFLEAYCQKTGDERIQTALGRALETANASVRELVEHLTHDGDGCGATLAAAVLHDDGLHWISVGDSRVYLVRAGRAEPVTLDHNYGLELDARVVAGEITPEDAAVDPDRESLVSYLGQAELGMIDTNYHPLPLKLEDLILVCSDGLYRALNGAEIGRLARQQRDPQELCESLVALALAKKLPHQDNCTVIAVSMRTVSARRTEGPRRTGPGVETVRAQKA